MQIKAILFDMFDTLALIDNNHEFYNHAIKRMHQHITTKQQINTPYETFYKTYIKARNELYNKNTEETLQEPHFNQRIQKTLQKLGHNLDPTNPIITSTTWEFCKEFLKHVRLDENTKPLLEKLYGTYKLAIISNFAIPQAIHHILETNNLKHYFNQITISGEVNKRKPSPEIFQNTLNQINTTPQEAVFIGDTANADIKGAQAANIKTIYIKRRNEKDIEKYTPNITITKLTEIPNALKTLTTLTNQ